MTWGPVVLGSPEWLTPALVAGAVGAAAVAWSYLRARGPRSLRLACAGLKLLALVLVLFCLLNPMLQRTRPAAGENVFVVMADNSRSLQVQDPGASDSRGEQLRAALGDESPAQLALTADFSVQQFLFDAQPRTIHTAKELSFDGDRSRLLASLRSITRRMEGHPVAGVLLLTDGNATDPDALAEVQTGGEAWDGMPPVYPVVVGRRETMSDLSVASVAVSETNFEATPVTVRAQLASQGLGDMPLDVELVDSAGEVVDSQQLTPPAGGGALAARFRVRPEAPGVTFYTVRVRPADDAAREATPLNNQRTVAVNRARGPYRVLYVSGRPNWEFKFFNRALQEDQEVALVALIRIAKQERKFEFRRRGSEDTNQLYQGFDAQEEEAEQYYEPVLLRVDNEEDELKQGFPSTLADLYRYDALVLDDLEASFFTSEQMMLVKRFVSERGGGLLMLGGQESFQRGDYARTPIGDLLPVYLSGSDRVARPDRYRMALSKEGWLAPWVRLRETEPEERTRLAGMPDFRTLNAVGRPKPGARTLAEVKTPDQDAHAALVAQQFGAGRSAALLVGDVWRWGLSREGLSDDDMATAWRQLVRWLVAEVPRRVQVHAQAAPSGAVDLSVSVRSEEFDALDNAQVEMEVIDPDGEPIQLALTPSAERAGVYEARFAPSKAGGYVAKARVKGPDGAAVGHAELGWASQPDAEELARVEPNVELLEAIAQRTGGELCELDRIESLVRTLPDRSAPITETVTSPLWHRGPLFALAILCLCAEWGLRRWKGLP